MGRLANNVHLQQVGYMEKSHSPAWNPKNGGQHGWAENQQTYISNQSHVNRPLVCLVLQAPRIFDYLPHGKMYTETFKAMMEEHSHSITGFDAELSVDFDVTPIGGAGQEQHEVVNVTRAQPEPVHSLTDKRGRPFQKFLEWWIRYALMDPETKHPLAAILNDPRITDLGPDMISASCLYFVPDTLFKHVDRAWICVNMMPHTQGTSTAQRNKRDAQEILNIEIPFTALSDNSAGAELLAERLMAQIQTFNADPQHRKALFNDIDPNVAAAKDTGYKHGFERVGKSVID